MVLEWRKRISTRTSPMDAQVAAQVMLAKRKTCNWLLQVIKVHGQDDDEVRSG